MRTVSFLMTALFATMISPAMAQVESEALPEEDAEEIVDPIRRYTVELIIFSYAEGASRGGEIWIGDEPATEAAYDSSNDNYFGDFDESLTEIETPVAHRYMDLELVLSGEDDYTMNGIYDKLVELDAYEPLVRTGWTQPTYEKEVTASIELQTLAESPPWLDGSLTLYLGRYLHLVVDLTMDADRTVTEEMDEDSAAEATFGDSRVRDEYEAIDAYGEVLTGPIRYRILEDRIMKNGDIRYYDHPKFGVVAKVTRFEEPEEDEFIDDTDDLLPGG
jgi:Peptidoglycan-binding protein, CsiV